MNVGMLWFCKPEKSLSENIAQAASYYEKKYGRMPTLCMAHPSYFTEKEQTNGSSAETNVIAKITVRPYRSILPGHVWIGVEEMPETIKEDSPS